MAFRETVYGTNCVNGFSIVLNLRGIQPQQQEALVKDIEQFGGWCKLFIIDLHNFPSTHISALCVFIRNRLAQVENIKIIFCGEASLGPTLKVQKVIFYPLNGGEVAALI